MVTVGITVIIAILLKKVFHFNMGSYEFSCLYMLLYLCINEILKES